MTSSQNSTTDETNTIVDDRLSDNNNELKKSSKKKKKDTMKKKKKKRQQQQDDGDDEEVSSGATEVVEEDGGGGDDDRPSKRRRKGDDDSTAGGQDNSSSSSKDDDDDDDSGGEVTRFSELPIVPELKRAVSGAFPQFGDTMTEIQRLSIPAALAANGTRDMVAQASTGSGKTVAFLLPVIALLCNAKGGSGGGGGGGPSAVVLSPVRELALQIYDVAERLLSQPDLQRSHGLRAGLIVGGTSTRDDARVLRRADVLVATPGRLAHHVRDGSVSLSGVRFFVLDEADSLLDQGFEREVREIVHALPAAAHRTTMLFSATMSDKVGELAVLAMRRDPPAIEVGLESGRNVRTLEQRYVRVPANRKLAALLALVHAHRGKKMIVFAATKKSVRFVALLLQRTAALPPEDIVELHGDVAQGRRTDTFREFSGRQRGILIATDVAARGLDIPDVDLVIQADFPEQLAQYFHRAGRTARAGRKGTALLMLTDAEIRNTLGVLRAHLMDDIHDTEEKLLEYKLPAEEHDIAKYQQKVVDAVYVDPELWELASTIPNLYSNIFTMYRRRYGFRDSDFNLQAVQESFGYGEPSQEAKRERQRVEQEMAAAGSQRHNHHRGGGGGRYGGNTGGGWKRQGGGGGRRHQGHNGGRRRHQGW